MTRSDLYRRALVMTNRVYELQEHHSWSAEEAAVAFRIIDESLPIFLHASGESLRHTFVAPVQNIVFEAFEPVIRSQGSPELKREYGEVIAKRGIHGYVSCCWILLVYTITPPPLVDCVLAV